MAIKRSFIIGALMALPLAGPAYPQAESRTPKSPMQIEADEKKKDALAIDKQYKGTLDRTRTPGTAAQSPADPWQNMRGADEAKTKR